MSDAPAAAGAKGFITKRIGPLPVWGWTVIGAGTIGILIVLRRRGASSSTASQVVDTAGTGASADGSGSNGSSSSGSSGSSSGGSSSGSSTPAAPATPSTPANPGGVSSGGGAGGAAQSQLPGFASRPPGGAGGGIGQILNFFNGIISPSGHVPSTADTFPAEYAHIGALLDFPGGPGHAGYEQLKADRQAQGISIVKGLGIDFTPTITHNVGEFVPGEGTIVAPTYDPFLASLRGTLDYASQRVGGATGGHAIAISTGNATANEAVARNLTQEGNTAAVVNGQVIAARSSTDFFNALPSADRVRLAQLIQGHV